MQKRSVYVHAVRPLLEDILRLREQRPAFATKCRLVPLKLLSSFYLQETLTSCHIEHGTMVADSHCYT